MGLRFPKRHDDIGIVSFGWAQQTESDKAIHPVYQGSPVRKTLFKRFTVVRMDGNTVHNGYHKKFSFVKIESSD
jgi:hypothetical protein